MGCAGKAPDRAAGHEHSGQFPPPLLAATGSLLRCTHVWCGVEWRGRCSPSLSRRGLPSVVGFLGAFVLGPGMERLPAPCVAQPCAEACVFACCVRCVHACVPVCVATQCEGRTTAHCTALHCATLVFLTPAFVIVREQRIGAPGRTLPESPSSDEGVSFAPSSVRERSPPLCVCMCVWVCVCVCVWVCVCVCVWGGEGG